MNKKKNLIFFLTFILLINCSFDKKTGIWSGNEKEKTRIVELEKEQKTKVVDSIYLSKSIYSKEISLTKKIVISKPRKNLSWKMSSLNQQNFLGNIYLSGIDNIFLKKKIGKNKFSVSKIISSPLVFENNIIFSDNTGTIFSINQIGETNWKKNIYKKIYKKVYKNLVFSIYKNNIYVADNIGFIYSIDLNSGKLSWIKNHGIPLKSNIKIYKNKIFLINQDNRILCLNTKNGSKIWDVRSVPSFIKLQNFLSTAISKQEDLIAINSSGDLLKINANDGRVTWSLNTLESTLAHASDFFKSSEIVVTDDNIIFSSKSSIFSYDLDTGSNNWKQEVSSVGAPIIDGKNIFILTKNGYFVIIDKETGKIISSTNILQVLKRKKQETEIVGFIMGSGKIYSVTSNGYLIVSSPVSGKVEYFKDIGDPIATSPIINDGKLYILTKKPRIFGFN
jgi:outer membrane protein assembly factor BamB|tara:strand:- start:1588 stop:2934 length:1347 start_codon:yes stop_codon:yes gene_type:complete